MTKYCIICGKVLTEEQVKKDRKTCSRSCATKNQWKNPERLASLKKKAKERWSNADFRASTLQRVSEGLKRKYKEDKQYYEQASNRMKAFWQDEEHRKQQSSTIKQLFSTNESYKEYHKQKTSIGTKKAYENPELRQKLSNSLKKAYENPELRQKMSNSLKKLWLDETSKALILQKRYSTMKNHKSFNSSKSEQYIKTLLQQKFKKVYYQYRSDLYPFNCDFYIEDLNLYIECHFNWTHGGRPFDSTNEDCLRQSNNWKEKAKTSKFYQNAIYQWIDLDARKRQCAIDNKLNWIAFYSYNDFKEWYNTVGVNNDSTND